MKTTEMNCPADYPRKSLKDCLKLIGPYVNRTPVMHSRLTDERAGAELYFKCENFQRGGSYKLRGATHAILRLQQKAPLSGVVTHSSGNFAQALSLAANALEIPAHIVMPRTAPEVKKAAVRSYGGHILECEPEVAAREAAADAMQKRTGGVLIHPSDDPQVMLGQGTAAMELLEEIPDLECIIAPVGGGGLLGGTCLAAHHYAKDCELFGAEPFAVDDAYRSLKSGKIESNETTDTMADGLKTVLGNYTFPVIRKHVKEILRVEEQEIAEAMKWIWERMKLVVEPSSAVTLAAIFRYPEYFRGKKVGIIISGGNVDLGKLPF